MLSVLQEWHRALILYVLMGVVIQHAYRSLTDSMLGVLGAAPCGPVWLLQRTVRRHLSVGVDLVGRFTQKLNLLLTDVVNVLIIVAASTTFVLLLPGGASSLVPVRLGFGLLAAMWAGFTLRTRVGFPLLGIVGFLCLVTIPL